MSDIVEKVRELSEVKAQIEQLGIRKAEQRFPHYRFRVHIRVVLCVIFGHASEFHKAVAVSFKIRALQLLG